MNTTIEELNKNIEKCKDKAHDGYNKDHSSIETALGFLRKKWLWPIPIVLVVVVSIAEYMRKGETLRPHTTTSSTFTPLIVTEPGTRVLVKKGESQGFLYKDLISWDVVPEIYVNINNRGWEGPYPPGYLRGSEKAIGAETLALRCDTQDFYVTLRVPMKKKE
jgi:hypothetical protein